MCGITGISWCDQQLIKKMTQSIAHRGPDGHDIFVNDNVSLGHRRLSILDLSNAGKQPMSRLFSKSSNKQNQKNNSTDLTITFNGEIYNYQEIRKDLEKAGFRFSSGTDTEMILAAFAYWGPSCVTRFIGMWTFCIYDGKELFISRDHVGVKPLYYTITKEGLAFASEMRALSFVLEKKSISKEVVAYTFQNRVAPINETLWVEIKKLPAGHNIIYSLSSKKLRIEKYWSIKPSTKENLRDLFESSVKYQLISDVPVGVSLSGGLDSALVAAVAKKHSPNITAYTVGFGMKGDEIEEAKRTASLLDINHKVHIVTQKEIIKNADKVISHLEEPAPDPAIFASDSIYQKIRKDVKVLLLGEGSDEIFGGYTEYKLHTLPLPKQIRSTVFSYLRKPYKSKWPLTIKGKKIAYCGDLNSYLQTDIKQVLPGFQLLRVDKLSMRHGLEARVPFLDHRLIQRGLGFKKKEKIEFFSEKKILKKAATNWLPKEILERRKKTFFSPLSIIEEKIISESSVIIGDKSNDFVNYKYFSKILENYKHLQGRDKSRKILELYNWWLFEKIMK